MTFVNRREFVVGAAALPLTVRFTPGALAGGDPVALVTADTESRVAVVELSTGKIVRSIPTAPGPRSVESVSGRIGVVCHTAHGAVSLIDGPTLRVRRVLTGFDEPRYTAAAPNGRHAFVSDSGRHEVVTVDVVHARAVARVAVGGPARHITIDPSGRIVLVSLGSKAEQVAVLDISRPTVPRLVRRFRPPFLAHDVGIVPGGRHVWVSSGDRGALAVYDRRSGEVLRHLPADAPPQHVTFSGGNAYVTSGEDGTLRVQSLRDGRVLHTTKIPVGSYNVQEAFGWIVTPSLDRGTFCVLDRRGRLRHRVLVAPSSHDACFVMTA
jgi:DNA-binding beta-propeller fold protein YncE